MVKKMIKLIALDLDGTLLNSQGKITEKTIQTIKKAQNMNKIITLSSGRTKKGLEEYIKILKLNNTNSFIIANTGSYIYELNTNQIIHMATIDINIAKNIYENTKTENIQICMYDEETLYYYGDKPNEALKKDASILKMNTKYIDIYKKENQTKKFGRINIMGTKENIEKSLKKIDKEFLKNYYTVWNIESSFEILNKKANKANALKFLAKYLKIEKEEIMAIGDNNNDKEMLEYAENSVAMGNSNQKIKKICKYTTKTNDQDGVAHAINKWAL